MGFSRASWVSQNRVRISTASSERRPRVAILSFPGKPKLIVYSVRPQVLHPIRKYTYLHGHLSRRLCNHSYPQVRTGRHQYHQSHHGLQIDGHRPVSLCILLAISHPLFSYLPFQLQRICNFTSLLSVEPIIVLSLISLYLNLNRRLWIGEHILHNLRIDRDVSFVKIVVVPAMG